MSVFIGFMFNDVFCNRFYEIICLIACYTISCDQVIK